MTTHNIVGFETGSTYEQINQGGTYSIQNSIKRTGAYALRTNPVTTAVGWIEIASHFNLTHGNMAEPTCYYRFYFRVDTLPASNSEEFCSIRSTTQGKLFLRITSAGVIQAYSNDGTTQLGSDGTTILATDGTWYCIEIKCGSSDPDVYEIKINNVVELTGTGNVSGGNNARLCLGKRTNRNGQSIDFYFDDVAIDNSAYPGPGAVGILLVDSDGTYTAWTIGAGGGSDWQNVDDIPPDAETTYLKSTLIIGDASTVGFKSTTEGGVSGSIYAVKHSGIYRRASSGATMALRFRSGGNDYDSTNLFTGSSFDHYAQIYATDPATGVAWTLSAIDAVESGAVEKTTGAGDESKMDAVYLMVDYLVASGAGARSYGIIF